MHFKPTLLALVATLVAKSVQTSIYFEDSSGGPSPSNNPSDGVCYNMPDGWNDRAWYAHIEGGICVFWADYGCSGHHTKTETGNSEGQVDFTDVCDIGLVREWVNRISSYKCYAGSVYPGSSVSCT